MKYEVALRKNAKGETILVLPYCIQSEKLTPLCFYKGELTEMNYFDVFTDTVEIDFMDCIEEIASLEELGFDLKIINSYSINLRRVLKEHEKMKQIIRALRGLSNVL